jgi:hypothetical protein
LFSEIRLLSRFLFWLAERLIDDGRAVEFLLHLPHQCAGVFIIIRIGISMGSDQEDMGIGLSWYGLDTIFQHDASSAILLGSGNKGEADLIDYRQFANAA